MSKNTLTKILAATVAVLAFAGTAQAGRGGSAAHISNAINSTSTEAIIAELERAERLICDACIAPVMGLLDDDRYEIREAAAWWFARRPVLKAALTERSLTDLAGTDGERARNAADILGTFRHPQAVAALSTAALRTELSAEARQHAVRALGTIGVDEANPALESAMADLDGGVRLEALTAWMAIRGQTSAAPAVALVTDGDAKVRAKAAAVIGEYRDASGRLALEAQLTDADPQVRRNAAWALGRIGDRASRPALEAARSDESALVRGVARAAIQALR